MVTPLVPPEIQQGVPIVQLDDGSSSTYFTLWLAQVLGAIVNQTNLNTSAIAAITATQSQIIALQQQLLAIQQAQSGSSGHSGAANSTVNVTGSAWVHGPVVNLTGVAAGNLTYPGSGPGQVNATAVNPTTGVQGSFVGDWRIQEVIGASETTVFSGTYEAQRQTGDSGIESILWNLSSTTGSVARTTTGAISYRLDIQANDAMLGDFEVQQVQLAIYVLRS